MLQFRTPANAFFESTSCPPTSRKVKTGAAIAADVNSHGRSVCCTVRGRQWIFIDGSPFSVTSVAGPTFEFGVEGRSSHAAALERYRWRAT